MRRKVELLSFKEIIQTKEKEDYFFGELYESGNIGDFPFEEYLRYIQVHYPSADPEEYKVNGNNRFRLKTWLSRYNYNKKSEEIRKLKKEVPLLNEDEAEEGNYGATEQKLEEVEVESTLDRMIKDDEIAENLQIIYDLQDEIYKMRCGFDVLPMLLIARDDEKEKLHFINFFAANKGSKVVEELQAALRVILRSHRPLEEILPEEMVNDVFGYKYKYVS